MIQEIPMSGTGSVLLMVVLILLFLLGALPILYYHGWNPALCDDEDWVWNGRTWTHRDPEPPPTVCTFYSAGMKVAIDEILKPGSEVIEIDTKSTEIGAEPSKNTQNP